MRTSLLIALLSACAAAATPAAAHADPLNRFVSEDGYVELDPDRVWNDVNAALAPAGAESVFLPAADVGPLPVSVVALEASEPALDRVRYRLRYGAGRVEAAPGAAPRVVSYIEVVRFNLGPAIRQELDESLGPEAVAAPDAFGVGPHVAWRLVTQPVMGNRAVVVAAGRRQVSEEAARGETCLGVSCLEAAPGIEAAAAWGGMESSAVESGGPLPGPAGGVLAPAAAVDSLLGGNDGIELDMVPGGPAIPEWVIEAVVELNIGQDAGLDAAFRQGGLLDDSVAAVWKRLVSFPSGSPEPTVYRASAYECARGREFAAPGEPCP